MRYILILLLTFFFTYANTNISADYNETKELSSLIKSIKSAKGDARRVKMNQLKLFLRSMNEKKRIKVIAKVKRILQEEQSNSKNTNKPSKVRKSNLNNQLSSYTTANQNNHTNPSSRTPTSQNNPLSLPIPKPTNVNTHIQENVQQNIQQVQEHIQQNINNVQHMIRHNIQQNIPMKFFPIFK